MSAYFSILAHFVNLAENYAEKPVDKCASLAENPVDKYVEKYAVNSKKAFLLDWFFEKLQIGSFVR